MNNPKRRGDQELTEEESMEGQGAGATQKSRGQTRSPATGSDDY